MIFQPLTIEGAFLIVPRPIADRRGFFARCWCREEFRRNGLVAELAQCNIAYNQRRGTVRGMHFQCPPHGESKLVRCTRGSLFDVIVDTRPERPTYGRWESVMLSADDRRMLYVPEYVAHGYQTLCDDTEVFYQVSLGYRADSVLSFRWDDPAVGIRWPLPPTCISPRDLALSGFDALRADERTVERAERQKTQGAVEERASVP